MRSSIYILAAVAGFGLIGLSTPRADAMNSASPAGLRAGLEAMNLTEPVHCRREPHKHDGVKGLSTGCKSGVVIQEGTTSQSGASIDIRSGTANRSGSGGGSNSTTNNTTNNTGNTTNTNSGNTNTGTGAGATTSTSTKTGGATYTGAGATSTEATTTTGGATTTTGGSGAGATSSTTGGTAGGTAPKQ